MDINGSHHPRRQCGFHPEDLVAPTEHTLDDLTSVFPMGLYPEGDWRNFGGLDGGEKKPLIGKDDFQVSLDVEHFQSNEISVHTEHNSVVINAKHKETRDDHGNTSPKSTRRYELPDGFKSEDVTSSLSSDGVLTIKASRPNSVIEDNDHEVQIQETGPARLNVFENNRSLKYQRALTR